MRSILFAYGLALLVAACNEEKGEEEAKTPPTAESTVVPAEPAHDTIKRKDSVPRNIQVDSIIHLAFPANSNSVTVKGYLDKKGDPVICFLPVVKGKRLTATVTPEKARANIRFSHIYMPGGKSDGPFSPSLKYELKGEGLYKLYIAPNRMAGDPVSTDFTLMVKVE